MISFLPDLVLVFYIFPMLYFIILGIPTFLIYDFGIYFLSYLRGVGGSSIIFFELMYDFIAVIIFYTRILVQGIRLVLMLFTYLSMQDYVLYFNFNQNFFFFFENFNEKNNLNLNFNGFSYFLFFSLPGSLFY